MTLFLPIRTHFFRMFWCAAGELLSGERSSPSLRWNMDHRQLLVLGMIAVLTTSCATKKLWEATDPEEYVSVPQSEVSEAELREQGVNYRKDDEHGVYYVEKSNFRRLGDYTIRFFATPVTVVLDAAPAIVVIGGVIALESLDTEHGDVPSGVELEN